MEAAHRRAGDDGAIDLFGALRATLQQFQILRLYREVPTVGGDSVVFNLGAEPFLLIAGGLLLVVIGIAGWRQHENRGDNSTRSPPSSSAA